jgi:hypothetical protein
MLCALLFMTRTRRGKAATLQGVRVTGSTDRPTEKTHGQVDLGKNTFFFDAQPPDRHHAALTRVATVGYG